MLSSLNHHSQHKLNLFELYLVEESILFLKTRGVSAPLLPKVTKRNLKFYLFILQGNQASLFNFYLIVYYLFKFSLNSDVLDHSGTLRKLTLLPEVMTRSEPNLATRNGQNLLIPLKKTLRILLSKMLALGLFTVQKRS